MRSLLLLSFFVVLLLFLPLQASAKCDCSTKEEPRDTEASALRLKFIAIATILAAGAVGVLIPILGSSVAALRPENDVFFVIKAFAAGVILGTGLIHILPEAFRSLTSPCLLEKPWGEFPLAGFVAMVSAMGTMMIDSFATSYYKRSHFRKAQPVDEEEAGGEHAGHVHVHTHATHGHAHGSAEASTEEASLSDKIRDRVISQVIRRSGIFIFHSIVRFVAPIQYVRIGFL